MRLFMFKSEAKPDLQAFAGDPSGSALPKQFAPWVATGVVAEGRSPPHGMSRQHIEDAIAEHGFQMWRMKKSAEKAAG
ncbi:MAG TPA: hypothetical protein VFQ27_13900 [Xanthobacteraceae bacterium]|nr:hypothetical protein [Xanthobacteraceae bacterium]